jgi:hypothetical protein
MAESPEEKAESGKQAAKARTRKSAAPVLVDGHYTLTNEKGLRDFVNATMADKHAPYKRLFIGVVSDTTQQKLKNDFGFTIKNVNIDNDGIIHAMDKAAHNLEADDLLYVVDVINGSQDIERSPLKHQNNPVLIFKKDIDGELTVLAEVRNKNGYLLVFNAWRKNRRRRRSDAVKTPPGTYVQNASPHTDTLLSDIPEKKSRQDRQDR